ncbi:MAG: phosphate acyltransferase PlsX [Eubacteriales bacterium]|jgi:glycerol-3-phosphate acyltransferase PlsX|nr:phosphate acyltransferase PlsX [Eubacteriales bacterium]
MKIIVDAMGGDNAPDEIVRGAFLAAEEYGVEIIMIGDENSIAETCDKHKLSAEEERISIIHTTEVVTMEDPALSVIRDKSGSSMSVGLRMLAEGKGDAFVSAGNTGALHAGSSLIVRRIKGIKRSAIAIILPFAKPLLLIDAGANIEVEPAHMVQFGIMGSIYMNKILNVEVPEVGLLSNGAESTKGTKKLIEAYKLMENEENINFVGNIEGKILPFGSCDVLVTDGFTGNILLKTVEGMGAYLMGQLKDIFYSNLITKVSALPLKNGLKKLKDDFDVSEYGGAPLLGLSRPVIKAHGNSDALAIKNAIRQAISYINTGIIVEIVKQTIKNETDEAVSAETNIVNEDKTTHDTQSKETSADEPM